MTFVSQWLDRRYGPPPGWPCTSDTGRCQFWLRGPDYKRPDCCTSHLLELLIFADELFSRHGIKHWIDYGTLLGAARNGRFIPWDSDVDMSVLASDLERVTGLRDQVSAAGYVMDLAEPNLVRIFFSRVNKLHLDVFVYETDGDKLSMTFPEGEWPGVNQYVIPRHYADRLGPVQLEGHAFPAPQPVEEFLAEHRYGMSWRAPIRMLVTPQRVPRVSTEDSGPVVDAILREMSNQEARLIQLETGRAGRFAGGEGWRIWFESARPRQADAARLRRRADELAPGDTRAIINELLAVLVILDESVEELEAFGARSFLRRNSRRAVRAARLAAKSIARRRNPT